MILLPVRQSSSGVEQRTHKPLVGGSNPSSGTISKFVHRMGLDKGVRKVAVNSMNTVTTNRRIPDIQSQANELTKRQMQEWFDWMDGILDVHRSTFVFREATPTELEEHEAVLKRSIRFCHLINALIADPEFNEPDLVSRL